MKLSFLSIIIAVPFAAAHMKRMSATHARIARRATSPSAASSNVAAGWYAGWTSNKLAPSDIPFQEFTHLSYAFAVTTADVNNLSLADSDEQIIPEFVQGCHDHNVNALISVGGWTGSVYFSDHVSTDANRAAFVKTVVNLVTQYKLDGVNFDWEYPNKQGIGCNKINSNDTPNFLLFLQALRADPVGKGLIITAAVGGTPFSGTDGTPSADVSGFAEVLDYIEVMNYDVWGSWSATVGPNAPLDDTCVSGDKKQGSAVSAIAAWTKAGIPADHIVLAVGSYGHSFKVTNADAFTPGTQTLAPYPAFDAKSQPTGDSGDAPAMDVCGVQEGVTGYFHFWGLIEAGFLGEDGKAAPGMSYRFDDCSKTPYVYNPQTQVMVSYDDADSFAAKGNFIKDQGLKGWAMWELSGDYNDILAESIREAAGFTLPQC